MKSSLTPERFETLAEAHGGNVARWPVADQAAARAFVSASPVEATAILARERALDAALDGMEAPTPSDALMQRILGDAGEIGTSYAERQASAKPAETRRGAGFWAGLFGPRTGWQAAAFCVCLLAGFGVGTEAPVDIASPLASQSAPVLVDFALLDEDATALDLLFDEEAFL